MSDGVMIALIVGVQGTIVALINAVIAAKNHTDTQASVKAVDEKVTETHAAINGRMDQLVEASKAQGAQDQRAETRAEAKAKAKP